MAPPNQNGMTNMNNNFELSLNDLDAVTGGDECTHGSGNCPHNGQGDGLGRLRQVEGGLIEAGKAVASSLLSIIT
jgi:hypothetical protein